MARGRRGLRAATAAAAPAEVRVAIYTRKSTDEGLDRDFNSLDNQRTRAEAYAASQDGWCVLPERYDDGGFSGGTTERPALRRLLADAKAGRFNALVVYRLDRLSRSLRDFLEIHEFLEKQGISLVSTTESLNTGSPHGRMMVNILLSFAQYERELASERTRDKIRAARRRGKYTGGTPPFGYRSDDAKLVPREDAAPIVRAIFERYAELGSLVKLAEDLNRRCVSRGPDARGFKAWTRVNLHRMLTNPVYIGKVRLDDQVYPGEHKGLVPKKLYDKVQRLVAKNRSDGGAAHRNRSGALLRGLLRCTACDRAMTHVVAKRGPRVHRYYRCQRAQKRGQAGLPDQADPGRSGRDLHRRSNPANRGRLRAAGGDVSASRGPGEGPAARPEG